MRLKVSNVCQLLDKNKFRETHVNNGITYTNNGNGTFTLNGTTTSASGSSIYSSDSSASIVKANHKYVMLGFPIAFDGNNYVYFQYYPFNTSIKYYILNNANGYLFFTPTDDGDRWNIFLSFKTTGFTVNNITIKPQLFDLTEMYGAGNEPTTVEQFRQDFPNEMYEYSPECWKKFRRLKYVTETKNLFDINKVVETVYVKRSGDGLICSLYGASIGTLGTICPSLKVGDTVTVSFKTVSEGVKSNFIQTDNHILRNGEKFTVSETGLTSQFYLYNNSYEYRDIPNKTTYYELQLEQGSTASPYQPYGYLPLNRGKYIANKEPVQLLDKSRYPATHTVYGITYTKNEDGSYDVNGTITTSNLFTMYVADTELKKGHWYLNNLKPDNSQKSYVECKVYIRDESKWIFPASRFKLSVDRCYSRQTLLVNGIYLGVGTVISNEKLYPELFDLTEMYGAGNEPTEEEFWATHPKTTVYDYNPYNAITFR